MLRRRRSAPVRRGTYQKVPLTEGPQTIWRPEFQSREARPVYRLRRGRFTYVPSETTSAPPAYLSQARPTASPRRGQYLDPPWGQGEQGQAWPTFQVSRRTPPRPVRRGSYSNPPWSEPDTVLPSFQVTRRAPARPIRRGIYLDPPWVEGPQSVWRPEVRVSWRPKRERPWRRGKYAHPGWGQATTPVDAKATSTPTVTATYTSTPATTAPNTSTAAVAQAASSTSTVA